MKTKAILPPYGHVSYTMAMDNVQFTCSEKNVMNMPLQRLTNRLWIEPSKRLNASKVIMTKRGLLTGIHALPEEFKNWFVGNDIAVSSANKKDKHTILFYFREDYKILDVVYFLPFDRYGMYERLKFARSIIPDLKQHLLLN